MPKKTLFNKKSVGEIYSHARIAFSRLFMHEVSGRIGKDVLERKGEENGIWMV